MRHAYVPCVVLTSTPRWAEVQLASALPIPGGEIAWGTCTPAGSRQ